MTTCQFWPSDPFAPIKKFFKKIINMIFICILATFNVQNFRKSLEWIQSFEDKL